MPSNLTKTNLFRPPYGRIKKSQFKTLFTDYQVVFWDVLSYDYDSLMTPKKCLDNSISYTRNGSIIVFHDNVKAQKNLKFALPHYIEHFLKLNYKFATL
jgi:peptidoglycan/xylan/chitin deacetylase (PgdA/CDA1 family)